MFEKNYKPDNLNESLLPVLILNWILGHQIMRSTMNSYKFIQTVFYFVLVVIIYGVSLGYSIFYFVNATWFKHTESVYFAVICTNILILGVNFVLGWFHRKKLLLINIKSLNIDKELVRIGVTLDKKKAWNFAMNVAIYWFICSMTINLLAMSWYIRILNWRDNFLLIFSIQHPIHVNFSVDLLFCSLIRNMEIRFKKINEKLIKLDCNLPVTNVRINENNQIYILRSLKEIHLHIGQQCNEITQKFGLQLIMSMASLFVLLTSMSFNLFVTVFSPYTQEKGLRIAVIILWIIIHVSKLIFINHSCSRTVNEWKKTGLLIHQLEAKLVNPQVLITIQQLSIQMIQNPLQIYPLGFVNLGHSFLQGFFGTIATYLVILIQTIPIPKEPISN